MGLDMQKTEINFSPELLSSVIFQTEIAKLKEMSTILGCVYFFDMMMMMVMICVQNLRFSQQ
jgi:hypothetical protein